MDRVVFRDLPTIAERFEGARGLAPACYTSAEFYALEDERIFRREWLCVGRADEVEKPGDYFSFDLLGEPLLVVRDTDGEIRVLSRTCRHRSMTVVVGAGNTRVFVCPYHSWTYALDGRLIGAPEMNWTPGFDLSGCRLPSLRSEIWEGFIFINFDPEAAPLASSLAGLAAMLRNYNMAGMKTVRSVPFDMDCRWNWKLMCDNYMEIYHHIGAHAKSLEPLMPARLSTTVDTEGPYSVAYMRYRSGESPVAASADGAPHVPMLEGLSPEERGRVTLVHIFPSCLIALYTDHMEFYRLFPEGPERTRLEKLFCVPPGMMSRADFDAAMQHLVDQFLLFRDEDVAICRAVQRALSSRFAEPGRLCHLEKTIWQFARYVDGRVRGRAGLLTAGA